HAAGDDQQVVAVSDDYPRLRPPQNAIRAPVFDQSHRRALKVAVELFQLRLEVFEERESIRRRPREAGDDSVIMKLTDFTSAMFHDGLPEAHLSVTHHDDFAAMTNRQYGCAVQHFGF